MGWVVAAFVAAAVLVLTGTAYAGAAELGTDDGFGPSAAGTRLIVQTLACRDFADIPAAARVDPSLDDTGGEYRRWRTDRSLGQPVRVLDPAEVPDGCSPIGGATFRASASSHGIDLSRHMGGFVPVGAEDGEVTSLLPGRTPDSGTMVVSLDQLTATQLRSLGGNNGLWVSAASHPGRFAGLQCHWDRHNADNLEVLRLFPGEADLACVLFVVGAAVPSQPSPAPAPGPTPVSPPAPAPGQPPVPAPGQPPAPIVVIPAPTPFPSDPGTDPTVPLPPPAPGQVPLDLPLPVPSPGPGDAALPVPGDPAPDLVIPSPGIPPPPLTRFAVQVEVGGVTQGLANERPGGTVSIWRQPLVVNYGCDQASGTLPLAPPMVPGSVVRGPWLSVVDPGSCWAMAHREGVTPSDVASGQVEVWIARRLVPEGERVPAEQLRAGEDTVMPVVVNFAGARVRPVEAPPAPASESAAAAHEEAAVPLAPPGAEGLTPITAVTLAAVFAVGLALSVVAARRPL